MKNKKGNVAVIAVIIAVVAISAGVFGWMFAKKASVPEQEMGKVSEKNKQEQVQPVQKDETSDWKIYNNEKYAFSFKYPVKMSIEDSSGVIGKGDDRLLYLIFDGSIDVFGSPEDSYNASVTVYKNDSASAIEIKSQNGKNKFVEKELDATGGKFILRDSDETMNHFFLNAYLIGDNYTFDFQLEGGEYRKDSVDLFKKILSTAKFADSEKTGQAYTNDKYGFQINLSEKINYKVYMDENPGNENIAAYIYLTIATNEKNWITPKERKGFVDVGSFTVWSKVGYDKEVARCKKNPDIECPSGTIVNNARYYFENTLQKPQDGLPDDVLKILEETDFYTSFEKGLKVY